MADGEVISSPALKADLSSVSMPVMIGTTRDEATVFLLGMGDEQIEEILDSEGGIMPGVAREQRDAIFESYEGYPSKDAMTEIVTDLVFDVGAVRYADRLSQTSDVYFYRFDTCPVSFSLYGLKACHACDIMMLADVVQQNLGSHTFASCIKNFVCTGSPNGSGLAQWPEYDAGRRDTMIIGLFSHSEDDPHKDAVLLYQGIEDLVTEPDSGTFGQQ